MTVSPTGVRKSILFALTRQELSSTQSTRTTLLKSNFRNIIFELHGSGIVVWCLRPLLVYISLNKNVTIVIYLVLQSTPTHVKKRAGYSAIASSPLFVDFDLTTKRSLAKNVCICLNHQELRSRLVFLSAGLRRWNYEVLFYVYRHGTHDPMMCLIFLILIIWADNNKVYNYRLHFSRFPPLTNFALRRNRANTASDSLFW